MATNKYLLTHESDSRWGITVNTVGMQDVAAGSTYPVGDHPEDYLFSPKKGRVLREAQIVYITKGSGWFESAHQPRTKLQAGDAVVLYPYEWHSYAPDPETGWSEAWIGFAGEEANALLRKFFPQKSHPIFQVGVFDALCTAYEQAYAVAENLLPAYQQQLIGYVWLIITTVYARSQQLPYLDNPDMTGVSHAIRYMRQHISSNIRMEEVAEQAKRTVYAVVCVGDEVGLIPECCFETEFHQLRVEEVVGIKEDEVFSVDVFQAGVACIGKSAVSLVYDFEPVVACGVFICDASATVGTAVIHEDGFPVLAGLAEDAVECSAQVLLNVVDGNDNGNHDVCVRLVCQIPFAPPVVRPEPQFGLSADGLLKQSQIAQGQGHVAAALLCVGLHL